MTENADRTERIVVQVTEDEKREIGERASGFGLKMSELMRRSAFAFNGDIDPSHFAGLSERLAESIATASAAVDEALRTVAHSNRRVEALLDSKK